MIIPIESIKKEVIHMGNVSMYIDAEEHRERLWRNCPNPYTRTLKTSLDALNELIKEQSSREQDVSADGAPPSSAEGTPVYKLDPETGRAYVARYLGEEPKPTRYKLAIPD